MRKVALSFGIVFCVFVFMSLFMQLNDVPGYGLMRVAGVGFFCLVALPLQLIHDLKSSSNGLRRTAFVVGMVAMCFLLVGLLFKAQSWPGSFVVLAGAGILLILYLVLFFVSSRQPDVKTRWWSGFGLTVCATVILLGVTGELNAKENDLEYEQMVAYESSLDEYERNNGRITVIMLEKDTNGPPDRNDTLAKWLFESSHRTLDYIEQVKSNLVLESNQVIGIDDRKAIFNGGDKDVPTWYLIGDDVQRPTGEGLYVFDALREFREDMLAESINFTIPTPAGAEVQDQWVKDNFYHVSVYEALNRLNKVQIAVQNSVIAALESDIYKIEE